MKMELEQPIVKTSEYQYFSELYPHIAESIRLKRKIERLTNILKSKKYKGSEFEIKREIAIIKTKLKKNNLLKRLHGESKQEAIFQRKFKLKISKMRYSSIVKKCQKNLGRPIRKFHRKLKMSMHKNLPPTLFNLRELYVAEKGSALKEWLQRNRNKIR
jgi:hypothetical protein